MIKILFVGAGDYNMYEESFYQAAKNMDGIQAELFTWHNFLSKIKNPLIRRFQNKTSKGPTVTKINKALLSQCIQKKFDIIFLYSCRLIFPKTLKKIRKYCNYIAMYNNDDPFSNVYPKYYWRNYRKSIPYSNIVYVYRFNNINDCIHNKAKSVKLLRSYYIKERNFYIPEENKLQVPDVLFLGHKEDDERLEYLKALTMEKIKIGIPEATWENWEANNSYVEKLLDTHNCYNLLLNSTKIAIVFLSKINHDTYTRRCFEIPAVKTLMVAPYTEDLANLFEENKEIVFYRNKEDFISKVKFYLSNEKERKEIAENAFNRLIKDGHEVSDRVKKIITDYYELQNSKGKQ